MLKSARSYLGLMIGLGALAGCIQDGATADDDADVELGTTTQALTDGEKMLRPAPNSAGKAQTATPTGTIDTNNEFFQALRLRERSCGSCHQADAGWTITPETLKRRFNDTDGLDDVFRPFDAANYPAAPVATKAERKAAYSRLLARGTIRNQFPDTAPFRQFRLVGVTKPVGEPAVTGYPAGTISFFRRPLPISNLRFASSVNWDGRSSPGAVNVPAPIPLLTGLLNQSNGATLNHAWLPEPAATFVPITTAQREAIVNQELAFHHAQSKHEDAGRLDAGGATGGPDALLTQPFTPGATSPGSTFTLFDAWANLPDCGGKNRQRRKIAHGQAVFNTKTFGPGNTRTCAGCHSTPNIGTSAAAIFFDVGVSQTGDPATWQSDLPLYQFERLTTTAGDPAAVGTGEMIFTTDPGRALFSGAWADMNKFKAPSLRGLASRAPYFHDGSAKTIKKVVDHYKDFFDIDFDGDEKEDLIMFLEAL